MFLSFVVSRRPRRCMVAAASRFIVFCWAVIAALAASAATETFNELLPEHRISYFLIPLFNSYVKSGADAVVSPKMARAAAAASLLCAEESPAAARCAPLDESLYVNRVSGRVYCCSVAPADVARLPSSNKRDIHLNRRADNDFSRVGRSAQPFRDTAAAAAAASGGGEFETPHFQKMQADKKASSQTYDYIRFGKRTVGYGSFGA